MNNNGYLIDNEIIFLPADKLIKSRASNKTQTLHAPAVRCLQLLIESETTVPQASLYKAGWGDDALKKVSTATYYQCFVNLRKQLREIGYSRELLITVPKEGIKINDVIEIKPFIPRPEIQETVNPIPSVSASAFSRLKVIRLAIAATIVAGIGGLIFVFMFVLPTSGGNVFTLGGEQYQHDPGMPECVYVRSVRSSGVDLEHINQFIAAKELSCRSPGKMFIHQGKVRTTVFHCTHDMNCHSLTYMNKPS